MGILDKLKGHKKDNSVSDASGEKTSKRSSSLGRKSVEKHRSPAGTSNVPQIPSHTTDHVGGSAEPVATYPVEGSTTVGHGIGSGTAAGVGAGTGVDSGPGHSNIGSSQSSRPQVSDNLSTAAIKDGQVGETDMDGLNRDLQRTTLSSGHGNTDVNHSYQPFSYDAKNLSQTPFDRDAFHASLGGSAGTTTYESVAKAAVVQETIHHNLREEVHPIFHREHHVIHHQTRIQPILEQVLLPAKHYVLIDGQKHEITGDAVMNHVVKARDYIPMSGVAPKVTVHQYVDHEPLVGPLTGVGASLINKDVMLEHQRKINNSYEHKTAGRAHDIPTGQITTVNYMPGQIPVSTVPGTGPSTLAQSSVARSGTTGASSSSSAGHHHSRHASNAAAGTYEGTSSSRLPVDDAIERTSGRLQEQRAVHN